MGTRFIATKESLAEPDYKNMVIAAKAEDIVYTPKVSGIPVVCGTSLPGAFIFEEDQKTTCPSGGVLFKRRKSNQKSSCDNTTLRVLVAF